MKIQVNKNILSNNSNRFDYFNIKNDVNDRHMDKFFNDKTHFEYDIFNTLIDSIKIKYIMHSGLNNLDYKIISRETINENVEIIKVSI